MFDSLNSVPFAELHSNCKAFEYVWPPSWIWVFGHFDIINADMFIKFGTLTGYCRPI